MRLQRIFNQGRITNLELYRQLVDLDQNKVPAFNGCGNEFKINRAWWVIVDNGQIIAYCGCIFTEGICIMNRAWVHKNYRGNGMQRKMILKRIESAKQYCRTIITYTTADNVHSANNLIKCGFKMYTPEYAYAGRDVLYWIKGL